MYEHNLMYLHLSVGSPTQETVLLTTASATNHRVLRRAERLNAASGGNRGMPCVVVARSATCSALCALALAFSLPAIVSAADDGRTSETRHASAVVMPRRGLSAHAGGNGGPPGRAADRTRRE